jgi:hypothetical protein
VAKKLEDVRVGDVVVKTVTVVSKVETPDGWLLTYSDATAESFDPAVGPAIYVEDDA